MEQQLIYHIDDTTFAKIFISRQIATLLPNATLMAFSSVRECLDRLNSSSDFPWIIFTDWKMPGQSGYDLLVWTRRHPKYHHIPLVMVTAEVSVPDRDRAMAMGAYDYLTKPIDPKTFQELVELRSKFAFAPAELLALDQDFARQFPAGIDQLTHRIKAEGIGILSPFADFIHTIKGEAASLEFHTIARFCHKIENLVKATKRAESWPNPVFLNIMTQCLDRLKKQLKNITGNELIELSDDLEEQIELYCKGTTLMPASGSTSAGQNSQTPQPQDNSVALATNNSGSSGEKVVDTNSVSFFLTLDADAFEVSTSRFTDLQVCFKEILQRSVQMDTMIGLYRKDYPDAPFWGALSDKSKSISESELKMFGLLIDVFSVPGAKIDLFFRQAVFEVGRALGKKVSASVDIEGGIEVDQLLFSALQFITTHLVRNAIDHGIESAEDRAKKGKPAGATIKFMLQSMRKHRVQLTIEDDGRGLDPRSIGQAAVKKGLKTEAELKEMTDIEIQKMIFLEGFSTAPEISEVSGRGIGLSAIRKLVLNREGTISVQSSNEGGASFQIVLPKLLKLML